MILNTSQPYKINHRWRFNLFMLTGGKNISATYVCIIEVNIVEFCTLGHCEVFRDLSWVLSILSKASMIEPLQQQEKIWKRKALNTLRRILRVLEILEWVQKISQTRFLAFSRGFHNGFMTNWSQLKCNTMCHTNDYLWVAVAKMWPVSLLSLGRWLNKWLGIK